MANNNYVPTAADAQKVSRAGGDQGRADNQDPNKRQSGKSLHRAELTGFGHLIDPMNL